MRILRRGEWAAEGPWGPAMSTPSRGIWVHHSAVAPTSDPRADMRTLERIGTQRFGRLSYSYAVHHPSGVVLEGQANNVGAHTKGQNSTSHGIVAMGNFDNIRPSAAVIESFRDLFRHGASEGWWQPVVLGGHRDAPGASTACPGRHLYAKLDDIRSHEEDDVPLTDDDIKRIWEYRYPTDENWTAQRWVANGTRFARTAAHAIAELTKQIEAIEQGDAPKASSIAREVRRELAQALEGE